MSEELNLNERILKGIELGESHFREFKSAHLRDINRRISRRGVKDICRDIAEALVSFANADGGEIFVGVEDDGTITGIPHDDGQIKMMQETYLTHIHPDTSLSPPVVKDIFFESKRVLYFRVTKSISTIHQTADGRCLQRFDRGNRPVASDSIRLERAEEKSREYDRQFISSASVSHLNLDLLNSVTTQISPGYTPEKILQYLDLAEYGPNGLQLRRAALLLFAKDIMRWHPRCFVRILRVNGNEIGSGAEYNVAEDDPVTGNVLEIIEKVWDTIRPHLARTKYQPNALFRESIIYPEDACREALINAVAHRDYSAEGEPIEIVVYNNRMEVRSPGGLLSSLTIQDLKDLKRAHQSRNVLIARVLRELGYMREMGEGMKRIFASIRKFDLVDPDIKSDRTKFEMILFHQSVFSQKDIQWLDSYTDFALTKDEQRVVLLGRGDNLLSTKQIIEAIGIVDTEDWRALFEQMRRKGLIYAAKKVIGGHKRSIPRFRIRPPQEIQQFLSEIQVALAHIGPFEIFDRSTENDLKNVISINSPYIKTLTWSLQSLGFLDPYRGPLPRLRTLWNKFERYDNKKIYDKRIGEVFGVVTSVIDKGYAFARSEGGEEFYLHASFFINREEFDFLTRDKKIAFRISERQIPGKLRMGKEIRVL